MGLAAPTLDFQALAFHRSQMRAARNETDSQAVLAMVSTKIPDIRAESVMNDAFWTEES